MGGGGNTGGHRSGGGRRWHRSFVSSDYVGEGENRLGTTRRIGWGGGGKGVEEGRRESDQSEGRDQGRGEGMVTGGDS